MYFISKINCTNLYLDDQNNTLYNQNYPNYNQQYVDTTNPTLEGSTQFTNPENTSNIINLNSNMSNRNEINQETVKSNENNNTTMSNNKNE